MRFLSGNDVDALPDPKPLIKGILMAEELVLLYAPKGCGKSFWSLDWDFCIASGTPWHGYPIAQPGTVVHVATEGALGYKLRKRAWEQHHGITVGKTFHLVDTPVQLLDDRQVDGFIEGLCKLPQPLQLVTFDTLSQCITAGAVGDSGENGNTLMNRAVAAARRIQHATKATILLVHHEGPTAGSPRGGKALPAGCDRVMHLSKPSTNTRGVQAGEPVTLTCQWSRDDAGCSPIVRTLQQVDLDEGRRSVVFVSTDEAAAPHRTGYKGGRRRKKPHIDNEALRAIIEPHGPIGPALITRLYNAERPKAQWVTEEAMKKHLQRHGPEHGIVRVEKGVEKGYVVVERMQGAA